MIPYIKKHLLFLILPILFSSVFLTAEENYLHISIEAALMASDPNETARILGRWSEDMGGYYTHMSTDYVVLRFPWKLTTGFPSYLEQQSDDVISYSSNAVDLRESIMSAKSGIEARNEILQRNLALISNADFKGTLFLENEILRLMNEIEELKGSLHKEENDIQMAQAVIQINYRSHSLPDNIPSSFDWINSLSFVNFIENSFYGEGRGNRFKLETPMGFALVDNRSVYRAISPEGVRFQIRKERNYPVKDIDFWSPALVRHMEDSGYKQRNKGISLETEKGATAFVMEWVLSMGNRDYIYMTGIIPHGKKIYIIEAAGEYTVFKDYKESFYNAMESFSP